jgi:Putative beta barrel porin-7 (BBP7)
VSADYTFGWLSGASAPPLLTAMPAAGGAGAVLFGDRDRNGGFRNGFQLRGGLWLDECGTCGIDAGLLYLCGLSDGAAVGDTPGTIVGRPFVNVTTGLPDAELVSLPGALSGHAGVDAESSGLCAADIGLRK